MTLQYLKSQHPQAAVALITAQPQTATVAGTTTDESDTELGNPGGQIEQLLPAPYLIGAFVAVFLGGALVSAMLTSCVCLLVMRYVLFV